MSKKHANQDHNFDALASRFRRNIYQTLKGQLRLAVLRQDFDEFIPSTPLSVLDVGAGQGHWALELTRRGHRVLLNDLSAQMLAQAQEQFESAELSLEARAQTRWLQGPIQELAGGLQERFDMITCHAMMEWLEEPKTLFPLLMPLLKPGAWLSLVFYNVHGLVYKNLLRGNFAKVEAKDFRGYRGSLTPASPLAPEQVLSWSHAAGLQLMCHSGIRVFHDYVLDPQLRNSNPEALIRHELACSRLDPYRGLGRYVHLLFRAPSEGR